MDFSDQDFLEILDVFEEESEEILERLNKSLLQLESEPSDLKVLQNIFRDATA